MINVDRNLVLRDIEAVFRDCQHEDWDGHNAYPVTPASRDSAKKFLHLLPESIAPPSIGADLDGEISFDWGQGLCAFSASVRRGKASYAAILGAFESRGTFSLDDGIPDAVLHILGYWELPSEVPSKFDTALTKFWQLLTKMANRCRTPYKAE